MINDQSEKLDSLNNELAEVKSSHSDFQKIDELFRQLEIAKRIYRDLKQKIEDQNLFVNKAGIAFKAKEELVGAKNEIIDNLKITIGNLKETFNCKQMREILRGRQHQRICGRIYR